MPVLNSLDRHLLEIIGEHESICATSLLNFVANEQSPKGRSEDRRLWLCAWHRLRRLLKLGLVFRANRKSVTMQRPVPTIRRTLVGRRPTVRSSNGKLRASTTWPPESAVVSNVAKEPQNQLTKPRRVTSFALQPPSETKSAPTQEQVSAAASALAKLPRRPKRKWSGWLGRIHTYRNMRIILPSGEIAFVAGVLRGKCVFTFDEGKLIGGFDGEPFRWGVIPAREVQILKNPAAQLLGRKKRGVKERLSSLKAKTARRNGKMPCREGRRRGRRCASTA